MNHTERVFEVARQVRGLTRELARDAIEQYLLLAAEEAALGAWVTLPGIGRLRIGCYRNRGRLKNRVSPAALPIHDPGIRVQACIHLNDDFKAQCKRHLMPSSPKDYPGSVRVQTGEPDHYPGSNRVQPGKRKQ